MLGFINHAVMLISGSIWGKKLWGHYWNWDPLETWSLIAFLFYAFYLHARSFLNWKMQRAAWLTVWGIVIIAGCVFCAVKFFDTDLVRDQIMYATIFMVCIVFLSLIKIFAWQLMHRTGIKREIKRLELRIAELSAKMAEQ